MFGYQAQTETWGAPACTILFVQFVSFGLVPVVEEELLLPLHDASAAANATADAIVTNVVFLTSFLSMGFHGPNAPWRIIRFECS